MSQIHIRANIVNSNVPIRILLLVIFVYACFGSPTPDEISWVELTQGIGIVIFSIFGFSFGKNKNTSVIFLLFIILSFFIGMISASSNDIRQLIRDIIAHLFFGMAIFWRKNLSQEESNLVFYSFTVAGAIISLRFLGQTGFSVDALGESRTFTFDGFLKLNTDPLVTFSAGYGICTLMKRELSLWFRLSLLAFSVISLMAIGLSVLRGPMAIVVLVAIFSIYKSRIFKDLASLILFTLFVGLAIWNFDILVLFFRNFEQKMNDAGMYGKLHEFLYVMSTSGSDILLLLIGHGFGSNIDVGGRNLPFTHSVHAYYFAKAGLISFLILFIFTLEIFIKTVKAKGSLDSEIILLFLICIYGLILNPHYKYMTFGVLLALFLQKIVGLGTENAIFRTRSFERYS